MKPGLGFEKEMLSWLSLVRKFGTCCLSLSRALFGYFLAITENFWEWIYKTVLTYYVPFLPLLKSQLIFSENFALVFNILNFDRKFSQSSPLIKEFFAYFFRTNTESVNRSWYLCTLHLLEFTTRLPFSIYELLRHRNVFFNPPVYYFSLARWVLQLCLQTHTYTYLSHCRINKETFQKSFKNF